MSSGSDYDNSTMSTKKPYRMKKLDPCWKPSKIIYTCKDKTGCKITKTTWSMDHEMYEIKELTGYQVQDMFMNCQYHMGHAQANDEICDSPNVQSENRPTAKTKHSKSHS